MMGVHDLPEDVLLHIMDWLVTSDFARSTRRLYGLWDAHRVCLPGATGSRCSAARWVFVRMDRGWTSNAMPPPGTSTPRCVVYTMNHWGDHPLQLCRTLLALSSPKLHRLCIRTQAIAPVTDRIILNLAQVMTTACVALRSLEFHVQQCHLSDQAFGVLGNAVGRLPCLVQLSVRVPMNSITIGGLQRFVNGVAVRGHCNSLRDVELDVCGNWIRGVEYGETLAQMARVPQLQDLGLSFGGWGVRIRLPTVVAGPQPAVEAVRTPSQIAPHVGAICAWRCPICAAHAISSACG